VFIILPLVLHQVTNESIDGRTKSFYVWLDRNQQAKIGFAERARQVVPFTREAIAFLLQGNTVTIQEDGALLVTSALKRRRRTVKEVSENAECIKKAEILGRWMATAGTPATIFASLGVRP